MPKLKIDGTEIEVQPGTSILQAAEQLGIEVPRFCYHDKLSVPANCRMCLVEVKGGPPKPVASCAMACAEGMDVVTDSDMVHRARKSVMEFLLINHPLDCPICDQGGECDLQDQAVGYGYDRSRYFETKRAVKDKYMGPLIKTAMTRCIQCTRCIRFGEEIGGVDSLGLLNRGEDVEIGTYVEKAISSELSGNMIDVCPVGALLSKPYSFEARPWELRKTETIDVLDAVGSNIRVDSRGREVMRIVPRLNESVNEEWISDKTRFSYDGLAKRRLDRPWVRNSKTGKLEVATWEQAFETVAEKMKATKPYQMAALAGDLVDMESVYALKSLMNALDCRDLECRVDGGQFDPTNASGYLFNTGIENLEQADAILLIGTNPRLEAPMVNARIRKAFLSKQANVAVIGEPCDLNYPYEHLGTGAQDIEAFTKSRSGFSKIFKGAKNPVIIVGAGLMQRKDAVALQAAVMDMVGKLKINRDDWNGFNFLHHAAGRVGALTLGFVPEKPLSLKDKKFVYLLGTDTEMVAQIPDNAFVVYQGHHGDIGAHQADVILPGCAYTEKDGMYMNTEGRLQMARKAVSAPGEAQEDWKIISLLAGYLDISTPIKSLASLRELMIKTAKLPRIDDALQVEWNPVKSKDKIAAAKFKLPPTNFYQTDPITRASDMMAECVEIFINQNPMLEAAE